MKPNLFPVRIVSAMRNPVGDFTTGKRVENGRRPGELLAPTFSLPADPTIEPGLADAPNWLLDSMPQLVWTANSAGEVTYVNAGWTTYTGTSRDALLGNGWTAAIDPAQRGEIGGLWRAAARQNAPWERRVRYRRSDGSYAWFLWRAHRVSESTGSAAQWIGTHTDIDAQIRLELALTANEERYRAIIDATQEGVWIVDAEANTRYVNRRFAEMLGYEQNELFGRSAFTLLRASDRDMIAGQFARRKAGEVATQEYCFTRRDRSELWTITAANPIYDDDGAFAGSLGMVTDITERRAMEQRLATAAAEYRSLAEATPQIVWSAQPDGAFDYVNGRWTEYTAIDRNDACDRGWIAAVHPDDLAALLDAWRETLRTGADFEATFRLRAAAEPAYRWHVMRARALRGADGAVARWFGTMTDIHAERQTARHLQVIARTSTVLAESFDRDALLGRLADLICEEFAEFVLIVLVDDERRLRTVATAHRDPAAAAAMIELRGRRLLLAESEAQSIAKMSRGIVYAGESDAARLADVMRPENCAAIARAGAGAFVCTPLQTRGRTLGGIVAYAPPGTVLNADEATMLSEIAARAAVAVDNAEHYAREHRVSATLQQALLPTRLPEIDGIAFDAVYQPGASEAQIGGDWYDAVELPDGRVIVSIGDVTGRGVRAAVIMGRVRQAIDALATYQPDPAQLLNAADAVLRRTHPDAIVTALVGLIDLDRRTFAYATAGHPTPIVRAHDGRIVTLPGSGLPLGLRDAYQPPTSTIMLPENALLLLYTDGLVESTRDIDEGERRVIAALRDDAIVASLHPANGIKAAVLDNGANDDVAVFTIRIGELSTRARHDRSDSPLRSAWSMHWSFDAREARITRDVRDLFVSYLRARGNPDADYAGAELVFVELLGNVARHAPGTVDIEVEWRGDAPVLHVLDRGPGYDRSEALPASLSETGRGLYLVATLTREFTVTRLPGYGSHARAVLSIERSR